MMALDKHFYKLTLSVKFSKLHCSAIAPASSAENQSKIGVSLFNKFIKKYIFFIFFFLFDVFFINSIQYSIMSCNSIKLLIEIEK